MMEVSARIYTSRYECTSGLNRQDRETCPEGDRAVREFQLRFTFCCETRGLRRNDPLAIAFGLPPQADILTASPTAHKTRDANYG